MFEWTTEMRFVVALVLGLLVGLERESSKSDHLSPIFAGVRTYPIISMFGFGCGWLFKAGASLALPAGMIALGSLAVITYMTKSKTGRYGATTEVSALLTFVVGALALLADVWLAMALSIANTVLLSEKAELETYVEKLNRAEFLAVLKFLVVTVIILPVLPNKEFTDFRLNPTKIWQTVILVSTVGFVGYFLSKRFGNRVGLWLSGILGGIVSSTAATIAVGRIAQRDPAHSANALQAAILAGSVMYLRVLALIAVINIECAALIWWKLLLLTAIGVAIAVSVKRSDAVNGQERPPTQPNPFELRPAIVFASLFVALSIVTYLVEQHAGTTGVLTLAGVVGVTDIDPFILSLAHNQATALRLIATAIMIAMMSNTAAKGFTSAVLSRDRRRDTLLRYADVGRAPRAIDSSSGKAKTTSLLTQSAGLGSS